MILGTPALPGMATASPSAAPGTRLPLAAENSIDHAGLITIITSFTVFLVLGSLGIRIYSAYIRRTRQMDDWTFAGTAVCLKKAVGQFDAHSV